MPLCERYLAEPRRGGLQPAKCTRRQPPSPFWSRTPKDVHISLKLAPKDEHSQLPRSQICHCTNSSISTVSKLGTLDPVILRVGNWSQVLYRLWEKVRPVWASFQMSSRRSGQKLYYPPELASTRPRVPHNSPELEFAATKTKAAHPLRASW